MPVLPPGDRGESGEAGHEVGLGRPDVAERDRSDVKMPVGDGVVVDEPSLGDVVLVEAQPGRGEQEGPGALAGWQALQVRDADLDEDVPAGTQVSGGVGEAGDLLVLAGQVHPRVETR